MRHNNLLSKIATGIVFLSLWQFRLHSCCSCETTISQLTEYEESERSDEPSLIRDPESLNQLIKESIANNTDFDYELILPDKLLSEDFYPIVGTLASAPSIELAKLIERIPATEDWFWSRYLAVLAEVRPKAVVSEVTAELPDHLQRRFFNHWFTRKPNEVVDLSREASVIIDERLLDDQRASSAWRNLIEVQGYKGALSWICKHAENPDIIIEAFLPKSEGDNAIIEMMRFGGDFPNEARKAIKEMLFEAGIIERAIASATDDKVLRIGLAKCLLQISDELGASEAIRLCVAVSGIDWTSGDWEAVATTMVSKSVAVMSLKDTLELLKDFKDSPVATQVYGAALKTLAFNAPLDALELLKSANMVYEEDLGSALAAFSVTSPDLLAETFAQLDAATAGRYLPRTIDTWYRHDSHGLSMWITEMKEGPIRQSAIRLLLDKLSKDDVESYNAWKTELSGPDN